MTAAQTFQYDEAGNTVRRTKAATDLSPAVDQKLDWDVSAQLVAVRGSRGHRAAVLLPGRRAADARRVFLLTEADTSGPVTVWDAATGEVLGSVDGPARLSALAFGTVGGRTVLATGHRGLVQLWDPVRGKQLEQFQGGDVGLVIGSVAGRDVIATGPGREVRIGDAGDRRIMAVVENLGATVTCLALATVRGRLLLVTGDSAGTVRMWDPVTGLPHHPRHVRLPRPRGRRRGDR
ncbi:WD40 repeat domain-containing protein [Streptomyces sp. NPDC008159]|uniref:WD40 repeat domain-containing protein n=1 Tax=Streptomyces sp. NPDC008159 TaxID=3364817 RepID=UPI0036E3B97A